jgi:dipeptidyl aminopeptidase/acylaminoacyl peptidase
MRADHLLRYVVFVAMLALIGVFVRPPNVLAGGGGNGGGGWSAPQANGAYILNVKNGQIIPAGANNSTSDGPQSAWSPDSRLLALAVFPDPNGGGGGLQVVSVQGGSKRQVVPPDGSMISNLQWSPDGSQLSFVWTGGVGAPQSGPSLKIWSVSDGSVRTIVPSDVMFAAWVPDGSGITVAIAPPSDDGSYSNARIATLDPVTGAEKSRMLSGKAVVCQRGMAWSPDARYLAYGGNGFHEGCLQDVSLGLWAWDQAARTNKLLFDGTADVPVWMVDGRVLDAVATPGGPTGLGKISLISFAPDESGKQTIAPQIPSFDYDNVAFETENGVVMYRDQSCDRSAAWVVMPGAQPRNATAPVQYAYLPALSPDGSQVAFSSPSAQGAYLATAPVAGGSTNMLLTGGAMLVPGSFSPDGAWLSFSVLSEWPPLCIP